MSTNDFPEKDTSTSMDYQKYGSKPLMNIPTSSTSTSNERATEVIPEPATGPTKLRGVVDLSKYRRPELVNAIDHLTSWSHAIKLLTFPALKIGWRSLMAPSPQYLSVSGILSQLNGSDSINHIGTSSPSYTQAQSERPTLMVRIMHFFFVGIPLAIIIGLLYGLINVINNYANDIFNAINALGIMYSQAKEDIQYFKDHPEDRPTKDETANVFLNQVIHPYSNALVKKKLGWFGFVRRPVTMVVNSLTAFATRRVVNQLDFYGRHVQNFRPFRDTRSTEQ